MGDSRQKSFERLAETVVDSIDYIQKELFHLKELEIGELYKDNKVDFSEFMGKEQLDNRDRKIKEYRNEFLLKAALDDIEEVKSKVKEILESVEAKDE